jgi:cell division inhibitor SepF
MSGAMRKMGVYLGLLEDTDRYDEELYEHDDVETDASGRPAPVAHLAERRRPGGATVAAAATVPGPRMAELSRITTLHPTTYNEARVIGENFREGIPVIMNLSEMSDVDAKRLVDFAAGLVFAVHGTIERITNKVFLLSPPNVAVAAEDKVRIAEGGFFNQS